MENLERFIEKYFIENNIPLRTGGGFSTVLMSIYGYNSVGCRPNTVTNFSKKYFSEKPKRFPIYKYILKNDNKSYCTNCDSILDKEAFYKDTNISNNLDKVCKECRKNIQKTSYIKNIDKFKIRNLTNKINRKSRIPLWADLNAIKEFYLNCPEGYEVDHIIPLQGKNISGLHVLENLQYLTIEENRKKGNKWPYKI